MEPLSIAWAIALVVTAWALPMGLIRVYAYRSGEIDHTRTMKIAAAFALTLGLVGLLALVTLTVVILAG